MTPSPPPNYRKRWKRYVEMSVESPEVHTPHPRHGGLPRWLELLIAITALITSVSSIAIAVHHGHIMEKLVQANSLPFMQGGFSDVTPQGAQVLSLDLLNRGVGPAHQQSLRVTVDGRSAKSLRELIAMSLRTDNPDRARALLRPIQNQVPTRFIPGGQEQMVFRLTRTAENAPLWDKLAKAQPRWNVQFCYCSVFDECWQVRGKWLGPERVGQCRRDETREFVP